MWLSYYNTDLNRPQFWDASPSTQQFFIHPSIKLLQYRGQNWSMITHKFPPHFTLSTTLSLNPVIWVKVIFIIFNDLADQLCVPVILGWTSNHFPLSHTLTRVCLKHITIPLTDPIDGFLGLNCTCQGVFQSTRSWFFICENKLSKNHLSIQYNFHGIKNNCPQ